MFASFTVEVSDFNIFLAICAVAVSLFGIFGIKNKLRANRHYLHFDPFLYVFGPIVISVIAGVASIIHCEYDRGQASLPDAWKAPVARMHELNRSSQLMAIESILSYHSDFPPLTVDNINHIIQYCPVEQKALCFERFKPYIVIAGSLGQFLVEGTTEPHDTEACDESAYAESEQSEVDQSIEDGTYPEKRIAALTESK